MDTIYLKGLEIFAYHGVNPEEKQNGQTFILDIKLKADLENAKKSDNLVDTISYAEVRKTVQKVFTGHSYNLIEAAAYAVCSAIIDEYPKVQKVTLKLKKPEAPMNAKFDYAGVKISKKR